MKGLLIIIIFVLSGNLFSQIITFNKTYPDTMPILQNIIEIDSGYYVLGGGFHYVNSLGYTAKIISCSLDSLGNLNWKKSIIWSGYNLFHGRENSLKKLLDNKFILGGSIEDINTGKQSALIVKFDENLDTLWSKNYFTDTDNILIQGCNIDKEGGFVFTGSYETATVYSNVLLFKTDSDGNMLWYKTYGNSLPNEGYKVTETWDNGYLIGGWTNIGSTYNYYSGEWYLIKADSLGNLKWQKNLGNPSYDDGRVVGLISTKDSCFIVTGAYTTGQFDNQDVQRARIVKIDTYGNIKWDKKYDYTGLGSGINNVVEQSDGSLITLGNVDSIYNIKKHAVLQKLSPDGDLIWRKRIWFMCENFNCYNDDGAYLVSLIQTNDGGFAMAGFVFSSYLVPEQSMWVVKTDSLGNTCFPDSGELGCMTIVTIEESPTEKGNPNINVFPNPSNGNITVDIQKEVNEETQIDVININGAIIYKTILQPSQTKANINISEFAKGVYFVNVKSSTFTETRKLIIQ